MHPCVAISDRFKVALYVFFGARGMGTNGMSAQVFENNLYFDNVTKYKGF